MCRWIAYKGQPIFIDQVVLNPEHSLVQQSFDARMRISPEGHPTSLNGDGVGVAWYGEKSDPGLFRDVMPAWNNQNLRSLSRQTRAHSIFAHVRAATSGNIQQSNCHPFKYKKWVFQHNGHIGDFDQLEWILRGEIRPEYHRNIRGNTDSEIFFHLALSHGFENHPKQALEAAVRRVQMAAVKLGTDGEMNFSCAMSDGDKLYTLRYSDNCDANTQFYSNSFNVSLSNRMDKESSPQPGEHIVIVSEPLDYMEGHWTGVEENTFGVVEGTDISFEPFLRTSCV